MEGLKTSAYWQTASLIRTSDGAGRGSRTPKTRRSADFESAASASSAIPAIACNWLQAEKDINYNRRAPR